MHSLEEVTYWAEIAIAGDYDCARKSCRLFCESGLCVTVTKTAFIYTGGEQAGVLVRLINYPRFPAGREEIIKTAFSLARRLRIDLCQDSFSIITPDKTFYDTRRAPDAQT